VKQQLGGIGVLDVLTKSELEEALGHKIDNVLRDMYRGEKLMRIPISRMQAAAATLTLPSGIGGTEVPGPEQGYIWRIQRIMVASNSLTDTAKYILYTGSDPTATDPVHVIEQGPGGTGFTVGNAFRPGNKSEWIFPGEGVYAGITGATVSNTYVMTGIVTEVPAEMIGKIL